MKKITIFHETILKTLKVCDKFHIEEVENSIYIFFTVDAMTPQQGTPSGNGESRNGSPRVGVFICHCGGNISDVVDVESVAAHSKENSNVCFSCTHKFMCSDPGQMEIEKAIKDHNLDRVIVAACSPTLHEKTFRRAVSNAGLNPYLYEHVNVREQVSWVIKDHDAATEKAKRLVDASVRRSEYLVPLEKRKIPIKDSAMVIGGGVAGLTSAMQIARSGIKVVLMEKSDRLGGRMLELKPTSTVQEL